MSETPTLTRREIAYALKKRQAAERRKAAKAARPKSPKADRGRVKDPAYLAWIRTLPCAVAGPDCHGPVEAAHVRYSDAAVGRVNAGLQVKPSDRPWSLPLCRRHHREGPKAQHAGAERAWWLSHGIDASVLCLALSKRYGAGR